MYNRPLKSMPYAQAHEEYHDNGAIILVSYETPAVFVVDCWLTVTCLCSNTTKRHVGTFMRDHHFGDYALARYLYDKGKKFNIVTGEIAEI